MEAGLVSEDEYKAALNAGVPVKKVKPGTAAKSGNTAGKPAR
jgi:hypothetical protein